MRYLTNVTLIINFKAVMMSYCLCFMLLWLNAKNNFQLNQQKLILNHELSFNVFGNNTKKECTYVFLVILMPIYMQQGLQVIKMEHKYLLDVAYMKFIALIL